MSDGSITIDTKLNNSGLQNGINKIKDLGNKALKSMTIASGIAISGLTTLGAYAVKVGSDFESGMSKVQAISGATGEEIDKLTEKAKEMGAKTKFSASESAEAFQYMAMAGWKTEDMLNGIEGIMNLAAASGEELASVSDIITDALTAFGLQAKDSAHFADVLARASSNSNTNVGLMGETFKYVAPLAGSMKYSVEDTAVAIGLMANAGIKGSQAGTALRSMLTRLVKPPKEAAVALDKLNISAKNSDGTMKPLSQTMQELRKKFANLSESQKASYAASIAGQEAMSGMLAIVNASDDDFNKLTKAINNSEGATKEMADTMNNNLKGATTIMKSNMESLGLAIYDKFNKPATKGIQSVTNALSNLTQSVTDGKLSESFDRIAESFGKLITKMADALDKYFPAIIDFISYVMSNAPMIVGTLVGIGMSFKGLEGGTKVVGNLTERISGISKTITKVPSSLSKATNGISNFVEGVSSGFSLIFSEVTPKITGFFGNIGTLFSSFGGKVSSFLSPVTTVFTNVGGKIGSFLSPIKTVLDKTILKTATFAQLVKFNIGESFNQAFPNFSAGISKIGGSFGGLFGKISPMLQNFLPMFTKAFNITAIIGLVVAGFGLLQGQFGEQINQIATMMIEQGPTIITNLVNGIVSALPQLIEQGSQLLQTILNVIITNLPAIIEGGIQIISALVTGLAQQLPTLIPMALELILTLVMGLLDNIDQLIDAGINLIMGLADGLINAIPILIEKAPIIIQKLLTALINNAPKIVKAGWELIVKLVSGIINSLPQIAESAGQIINTIWNTLKELPQKALEWGKDMVQGFINGIKNMLGNLAEAASNVGAKIREFLHFSRPDKGPLREYEKWMPDMIRGLSKTLNRSAPQLYEASEKLAEKVKEGLDLNRIFEKMKATVDYETTKLSTNLTTKAMLQVEKEQPRTVTNDNGVTINNTQQFYSKNSTPYEEQKQAKQQLRRLAYGL